MAEIHRCDQCQTIKEDSKARLEEWGWSPRWISMVVTKRSTSTMAMAEEAMDFCGTKCLWAWAGEQEDLYGHKD